MASKMAPSASSAHSSTCGRSGEQEGLLNVQQHKPSLHALPKELLAKLPSAVAVVFVAALAIQSEEN